MGVCKVKETIFATANNIFFFLNSVPYLRKLFSAFRFQLTENLFALGLVNAIDLTNASCPYKDNSLSKKFFFFWHYSALYWWPIGV